MSSRPLDRLFTSLRGDPDEGRVKSGLRHFADVVATDAADQGAVVRILSELLTITQDIDRQTRAERRQIAGFVVGFGECIVDVLRPSAPAAFSGLPSSDRTIAVMLHTQLREERQFNVVVPILAAAGARHRHRGEPWLVLVAVLEALLKLPADFSQTDRRRLTWYAQQLFSFWLEPREVAMLIHARWIQAADEQQLEPWRGLVPTRRPLLSAADLADLLRGTRDRCQPEHRR